MTEDSHGLPEAELLFTDKNLPFTLSPGQGGVLTEGQTWTVTEDGASVILEFEGVSNCELYLGVENLSFSPAQEGVTDTVIQLFDGFYLENLKHLTPNSNYTSGRADYLVNTGYCSEARTQIVMTFSRAGVYTFSNLYVAAQPMDHFAAQTQALADSGISDIQIENGGITFRSHRDTPGIACIAVPYQPGWSATVDGAAADVFRIQDGLCGVYLQAGQHQVTLSYENPFLIPGWLLFALGAAMLCFITVFYENRRKH